MVNDQSAAFESNTILVARQPLSYILTSVTSADSILLCCMKEHHTVQIFIQHQRDIIVYRKTGLTSYDLHFTYSQYSQSFICFAEFNHLPLDIFSNKTQMSWPVLYCTVYRNLIFQKEYGTIIVHYRCNVFLRLPWKKKSTTNVRMLIQCALVPNIE